jgi:para-nitrobenzyl esterase
MSPRIQSIGRLRTLLAFAATALLPACFGGGDMAPAVAHTDNGDVVAVDRTGVAGSMRSYFRIPFAAPPVGALRWAPPAPAASWSTPLNNQSPGAACIQTSASSFRVTPDSEDCLYLDVHAPAFVAGKKPVMVWIHGGANNTGAKSTYAEPSPLVSKGVIVVAIQYRMGALGFLGHPVFAAADGSVGNYGIMDQIAALQWVQKNIAAFGGDPGNVTLFGESAGGNDTMAHLASPLSKGLFHKAILQSANYSPDRQLSLDALKAGSTAIVNNALTAANYTCPGGTVDAACLRGLPASFLQGPTAPLAVAFNTYGAPLPNWNSPVAAVDGHVLPVSIKDAFIAGTNNKVPLMNGSNMVEWSLFIAANEAVARVAAGDFDPTHTQFALQPAAYQPYLAGISFGLGVGSDALANTYYPMTNFGSNTVQQPSLGASAAGTDIIFACNAFNLSKRAAGQGQPVFEYEFRDQTAIPSLGFTPSGVYYISFPQGAGHSYELQYLFTFRDLQNADRRNLSDAMTTYWTNFAKNSDPNQGITPAVAWPQFTSNNAVLGLDIAPRGVAPVASFGTNHQCATVWTALTY